MKNILVSVFLFFSLSSAHAFNWFKGEDFSLSEKTIDYWQPAIDENWTIPARPYDQWNYYSNMKTAGLTMFERLIPTYNKKGKLFASWNPAGNSNDPRPTIVILHGGHGINPTELNAARFFKENVNANVLILDSFWSRGKFENHQGTTQLGADTRVLDVLAAYEWLSTRPEFDHRLFYVYGGSLGGQVTLRLMTDYPFINHHIKGKIKAAFSLYPFCRESPKYGGLRNTHTGIDIVSKPWLAPALGPYTGPVYVFTGGRDEPTDIQLCDQTIFTNATEWHHYPNATHSWDLPNRGTMPAVNGECSRAKNPFLRFEMCRDDAVTLDVLNKILTVIRNDKLKVVKQ